MEIKLAEQKIQNLIQTHLGSEWRFRWDTAERRFGCCHGNLKLITMSKALVELNDWEQVRDTALHEIAHGLAGCGHGHDECWKRKCIQIGCRPERCYSNETVNKVPPKYMAICPYCGHKSFRRRMPRKVKYSCGTCSKTFREDRILEFKPYNPVEISPIS